MKVWDTMQRAWVPYRVAMGACCSECERTGGSCGGGTMRGAAFIDTDAIQGTMIATTQRLACEVSKASAVPIVGVSLALGGVLGAIIGAVAQDSGKRAKGAAWGAGVGALAFAAMSGASIAITCAMAPPLHEPPKT